LYDNNRVPCVPFKSIQSFVIDKTLQNCVDKKFGKSINGTLFIICTIYMAMQMQPKIFEGFLTAALSHYELGSRNTAPRCFKH